MRTGDCSRPRPSWSKEGTKGRGKKNKQASKQRQVGRGQAGGAGQATHPCHKPGLGGTWPGKAPFLFLPQMLQGTASSVLRNLTILPSSRLWLQCPPPRPEALGTSLLRELRAERQRACRPHRWSRRATARLCPSSVLTICQLWGGTELPSAQAPGPGRA